MVAAGTAEGNLGWGAHTIPQGAEISARGAQFSSKGRQIVASWGGGGGSSGFGGTIPSSERHLSDLGGDRPLPLDPSLTGGGGEKGSEGGRPPHFLGLGASAPPNSADSGPFPLKNKICRMKFGHTSGDHFCLPSIRKYSFALHMGQSHDFVRYDIRVFLNSANP